MGGDYYDRDVPVNTGTTYSTASASAVGVSSKMHSSMNPTRWADENLKCENKNPIVFALDVTGSMGDWTKIIYDKMPMFYGQIMMQKYLEDPALSFCAIGDCTTDSAPLQPAEFGQGNEIDQLISKMYLEGGGGGNQHESYDLSAYFYANYVDLINCEIPFFFVTGDEGFWPTTKPQHIQLIFGKTSKGNQEVKSEEQWKLLMQKYNVFHIKKPFNDSKENVKIQKQWVEAIGEERVLNIVTPKACIDVVLGIIALTSGSRDLKGYTKDMVDRGQSEDRIKEVLAALKNYNDKLVSGKLNVIRHKLNPLDQNNIIKHEIKVEVANPKLNAVSNQDILEIRELTEKLMIEDLNETQILYRENLRILRLKLLDAVPKEFICPLTQEILYDPVMTSDGYTFERKAIECWLEKHDNSPVTSENLDSKSVLPNFALKQLVRDYYESSK